MAENQLQTAIKFIYGVHIQVDDAAKGNPEHESAQFIRTKQN